MQTANAINQHAVVMETKENIQDLQLTIDYNHLLISNKLVVN